jgi:hypothetical protein
VAFETHEQSRRDGQYAMLARLLYGAPARTPPTSLEEHTYRSEASANQSSYARTPFLATCFRATLTNMAIPRLKPKSFYTRVKMGKRDTIEWH